jgi:hypothetical protein
VSRPTDTSVRDVWFGFDGLNPGWALLLAGVLAAITAWLYLRGPGDLGRPARLGLTALRAVLIAGLLLLLTRPVLQLTRDEPTRGTLLTLVDTSASQDLADPRTGPDLARAAIATGALSPGAVDRAVPAASAAELTKKNAAQPRRRRLHQPRALAGPALARSGPTWCSRLSQVRPVPLKLCLLRPTPKHWPPPSTHFPMAAPPPRSATV